MTLEYISDHKAINEPTNVKTKPIKDKTKVPNTPKEPEIETPTNNKSREKSKEIKKVDLIKKDQNEEPEI